MPRARNGRYGVLGNRTARVPGRWVRWIGWIGVWDAGRDLCGVDHLEHAQPYVPTATENGTAGRGDIHTNAINNFWFILPLGMPFGPLGGTRSTPLVLNKLNTVHITSTH